MNVLSETEEEEYGESVRPTDVSTDYDRRVPEWSEREREETEVVDSNPSMVKIKPSRF